MMNYDECYSPVEDDELVIVFARMLQSLLTASGVNPSMVTVFIDGYFEVNTFVWDAQPMF